MTILCIGDSDVKRFDAYIGNRRASSELFDIVNLPHVDFFGISGGAVNNSRHLETVLAAVQHYRPTCLIVHLGGNDLDCREVTVDSVIYKLVAFLTQIRRQFNINHITVPRYMPPIENKTHRPSCIHRSSGARKCHPQKPMWTSWAYLLEDERLYKQ